MTLEQRQEFASHVSLIRMRMGACKWIPEGVMRGIIDGINERLDGSGYPLSLSGNQLGELARVAAVVDVIEIKREYDTERYNDNNRQWERIPFNETAFSAFINDFFKVEEKEEEEKDTSNFEIKNMLVQAEIKASMLVELYQYEYNNFLDSFNALKGLNRNIFNNLGIDLYTIQKSMQKQITGLKTKYWQILFEEFDELKEKLTNETRRQFIQDFRNLLTIDFTIENIWVVLMWVIKNANKHYDGQLISFYKKLSSPENIKNYKSNKRDVS